MLLKSQEISLKKKDFFKEKVILLYGENQDLINDLNQQITSKFTEEELKRMQLIRISEPISLEIMADILKTDARQLERWNDDLFLQINKPGDKSYWLRLPKDKIDAFLSNKEEIIRRSKQFFGEIRS